MKVREKRAAAVAGLALILAAVLLLCLSAPASASADGLPAAEKVNWSLVDDLTSYNEGNWSKRDPFGTVSFGGSILFTNDRADRETNYEGARLVSNTKFVGGNGTVFDMSFVPYVINNYKGSADPEQVQLGLTHIRLNREMSFGVLFGMPTQNAPLSQVNYLRISPPAVELYVGGEKAEPIADASSDAPTDSTSYMDIDDPNTVRLKVEEDDDPATENLGTVTVYVGNARGHSIDTPLAVYENVPIEGFVAFTTNSYNIDAVDLPLGFRGVSLTGCVVRDFNDFDVLSVSLDKSNLRNAVVSEKPIALSGKVISKPNIAEFHDVVYSVKGGNASVEGNLLTVRSEETFTVRMTSKYNQRVYDEYTVTPKVLRIDDISIVTDGFEGLTVYSQPVLLSAIVTSNYNYIRELNEVTYTVVSGPAEVFTYYSVTSDAYLSQLRVTGAGKVVLRATSTVLDDAYDEVTFTVTDPEKQKKGCGGCKGSIAGVAGGMTAGVLLLATACCLLLRLRRTRKTER